MRDKFVFLAKVGSNKRNTRLQLVALIMLALFATCKKAEAAPVLVSLNGSGPTCKYVAKVYNGKEIIGGQRVSGQVVARLIDYSDTRCASRPAPADAKKACMQSAASHQSVKIGGCQALTDQSNQCSVSCKLSAPVSARITGIQGPESIELQELDH